MIVLDSYAVIALLRGEAAAGAVEQLVVSNHDAGLTALGLAEVLDHLVRLAGAHEDEAVLDVAQLGLAPHSCRHGDCRREPTSSPRGVVDRAGGGPRSQSTRR